MDAGGLIPYFGNFAYTVIAFVAALSVVVTVHEYGHYIIGRLSGIHAEVFSLGFGPVLAKRTDRHGTQWQIAAIPLGGYVRFLGDADAASASQDEGFLEHLAHAEREKELRRTLMGAPLWARAATVAAGPVFNFILAALIFAGVFLSQGRAIEPPTVASLVPLPEGAAGLEPGDAILALNGVPTPDYQAFYDALDAQETAPNVSYTVRRDGQERVVEGLWPVPAVAASVAVGSAAMDAGLKAGDVILAVDGQPVSAFDELPGLVAAAEGRQLVLTIWRDGQSFETDLAPRRTDLPLADGGFETRWLIGLTSGLIFTPETGPIGPVAALRDGAMQVVTVAGNSLSAFYHIVTGAISSCNLGGPIKIAQTSGEVASLGISEFIWFIGVLSAAIGLMNLFPVPVLDGGHLVFHAWEAITRRPPSERAVNYLMRFGLTLIVMLMAFALFNDIRCP